jgi:hypothetical protein
MTDPKPEPIQAKARQNFGMSMPGWYDISKLGRDVRLPDIPTKAQH